MGDRMAPMPTHGSRRAAPPTPPSFNKPLVLPTSDSSVDVRRARMASPDSQQSQRDNRKSTKRGTPSTAKSGDGDIPMATIRRGNTASSPRTGDNIVSPSASRSAGNATPSSSSVTAPVAAAPKVIEDNSKAIFVGKYPLQYALWAHWMGFASAILCIVLGLFAILWVDAVKFNCTIDGTDIYAPYIADNFGTCTTAYTNSDGEEELVCCDRDQSADVDGSMVIGIIYLFYGIFQIIYNDPTMGLSLWIPNDTVWFEWGISPVGILDLAVGVVGLAAYSTCLAGGVLLTLGLIRSYAAYRREAGDGGYFDRKSGKERAAKAALEAEKNNPYSLELPEVNVNFSLQGAMDSISEFFLRIHREDKLSTYVWVFVYAMANFILFVYTLNKWYVAIELARDALLDGALDISCHNDICHQHRILIRYGPVSYYASWAKAAGGCLNLNCAMIILPVTKILLNKLNNAGVSFSRSAATTDYFSKFFAHPMTRYIPMSKNIDFHKLIAAFVAMFSLIHILFHLINLTAASRSTLARFKEWGWTGTYLFTGAVVTYAMIMMYTSSPDQVRHARFEIFINNHQCFMAVAFLFLLQHGPVFVYWGCIPITLYIVEKYMERYRGGVRFAVIKVEYIAPVMAIYFKPINKGEFTFKEGQYINLACPFINDEWHPFTISSAADDLNNGPRIHLETGEQVVAVPRPNGLRSNVKWSKFCEVSRDWRGVPVEELLDKGDTGFCDFVSVHIKVHGLDAKVAKSWTRKLKEYFEMMSPAKSFPYFYTKRDHRGEIILGRDSGPDNRPILQVDGPHSAPCEHYSSYGTVMLVAAGIGLTPCTAIMSSLAKYRWKRNSGNSNPEIVHFYWVVRQSDVDSFQWFVHLLTEISYEIKKSREINQIESYLEINIYVTAAKKEPIPVPALKRAAATKYNYEAATSKPYFTAPQLFEAMMNPKVSSKGQVDKMKTSRAPNRLQDIWVWSGRPIWDDIFQSIKEQRQHSDIGVCFCGTPMIGADLKTQCEKHSNVQDECVFSLHKENF